MEITDITVYQVDLPIAEGSYDWADGRSYEAFDATIVRLATNAGFVGWGEVVTLGSGYLPAFARGARAGIEELAPTLLGADPTEPAVIAERCARALRGQPYAKSALDIACWDLAGKATDQPLGGLTRARTVRDLCVDLGFAMILEDTWGSEIATAAIAHLAASTPERGILAATDFHNSNAVSIAEGAPTVRDGHMTPPSGPGLGVEPMGDVLGSPPLATFSK